jgi:hypothetical protein
MDKLEELIRKNRKDMDKYNPSSVVWKRIERELKTRKTITFRWVSAAAMIIIVLGGGLLLLSKNELQSGAANIIGETDLSLPNPHLNETEIYYNNLVNSLYREASPLLVGNPEIREELTTDISHLDSIYFEIKRDLKDNMANQEVVEALIQNYRIRIRLLEDMLVILKENEGKTEKIKSHEL